MRTTLTLDDDAAALLRRAPAKRGVPLKAIVNEALRAALARDTKPTRRSASPPAGGSTDGDFARFPGRRWDDPLA